MGYAQINYSQRLGNGPYEIAAAGCFLTAFCNLLGRFGENIDPPTLNQFFLTHNKYNHDPSEPAGTVDDLTWGAVTAYDSRVVPVAFGSGWPSSNDAILEVRYIGPKTGKLTTHFVLCVDHSSQTILDSYDGVVKKNPYGTPVAFAVYERQGVQAVTPPPPPSEPVFTIENIPAKTEELKVTTHLWNLNQRTWPGLVNNPVGTANAGAEFSTHQIAHHILGGSYYLPDGSNDQGYNVVDCETPIVVAPPAVPVPVSSTPPQGALNVPSGRKYTLVVSVPGYSTATQAGNHQNPKSTLQAGNYFIFNTYPNNDKLLNLTKTDGTPGAWVNTNDNVKPEPIPAPAPAAEAPVEAPVSVPAAEPTWQDSYVAFKSPVKYISTHEQTVRDLSSKQPDITLPQYNPDTKVGIVSAYGTVTFAGVDYYRLKTNNDPDFNFWYCVPRLDPLTRTPSLLVYPAAVKAAVGKGTIARDAVELGLSKFEASALNFVDDILPKWFKNKK